GPPTLFAIDSQTGQQVLASPLPNPVNSLAVDPTSGKLLGIVSTVDFDKQTFATWPVQGDPDHTAEPQPPAPFATPPPLPAALARAALDPPAHRHYSYGTPSQAGPPTLFAIDTQTGQQVVASPLPKLLESFKVDPATGALFGTTLSHENDNGTFAQFTRL